MALAVVATAAIAVGHALLGQVGASETVVYKQCYRPPSRLQFGRFPECGIESTTSTSSESAREDYFCFRGDGTRSSNRDECGTPPSSPVRTPEQERAIIQLIENQRAEAKRAQRQRELLNALENASQTLTKYAGGKLIALTAAQQTFLEDHAAWLATQINIGGKADYTLSELNSIAGTLRQRVASARETINAARKSAATAAPAIENIMLRIDDLVRRVGTLIGSLEKEGMQVPLKVKGGYERAKAGMTIAQRTCSPRRPHNCLVLNDVLDELEAMREPLCALPSDRLTFCTQ